MIIALGQNDLQSPFDRNGSQIAEGVRRLAACVGKSAGEVGTVYAAPQVLVIAPAPLGETLHPVLGQRLLSAKERSQEIGSAFNRMARSSGLKLVDSNAVIGPSAGIDGRHYSADQHRELAAAIAQEISRLYTLQSLGIQ